MKYLEQKNKMLGLLFFTSTVVVIVALVSYRGQDVSYFNEDGSEVIGNILGFFGAQVSSFLFYFFGGAFFFQLLSLLYLSYLLMKSQNLYDEVDRFFASFMLTVCCACLAGTYSFDFPGIMPGGFVGQRFKTFYLTNADGVVGLWFVFCLLWASIVLLSRLTFVDIVHRVVTTHWIRLIKRLASIVFHYGIRLYDVGKLYVAYYFYGEEVNEQISPDDLIWASLKELETPLDDANILDDPLWRQGRYEASMVDESTLTEEISVEQKALLQEEIKIPKVKNLEKSSKIDYKVPPISLLAVGSKKNITVIDDELKMRAKIVEEKLAHFGVKGIVVSITPGPIVTLFEFHPDINIKISRILALEDDLALALKAHSLRIIAPIPGKSVVGFEVANSHREMLYLAPLISSSLFTKHTGFVPIVLGYDTVGVPVIIDVAAAPHLLIAGSTGSGKSVALNVMLTSMLYKRTPEELRLILIDPKRLEFAAYADIPHLLCPIITHPTKAILGLKWVLKTMEERYDFMASIGVKNIGDYKLWCKRNGERDEMPLIVVMIDELADLMLVAGHDIEDLLARTAQMARAAGIHLVVATQRPSVDVITGVIKVNFPSRIAFKVISKIDSRTILDAPGAEKLLGRGDMLYLAPDGSLGRFHGAFVSSEEIVRVVDYIKKEHPASYSIDLDQLDKQSGDTSEKDPLYPDIIAHVKNLEEVSISQLQRTFRIGYNRSARIIDMLERDHIIMPADGGKMRKVIR